MNTVQNCDSYGIIKLPTDARPAETDDAAQVVPKSWSDPSDFTPLRHVTSLSESTVWENVQHSNNDNCIQVVM
jgi:hypothetical protein